MFGRRKTVKLSNERSALIHENDVLGAALVAVLEGNLSAREFDRLVAKEEEKERRKDKK